MFLLQFVSRFTLDHPLSFEQPVFFPGNERHGIWSCRQLVVVVPPTFKPGYPYMADHGLPMVADSSK